MHHRTPDLAARLASAMTQQRVTQVALSETTGIPRTTLQRHLRHPEDFKVRELHAVCLALGIEPPALLAEASA